MIAKNYHFCINLLFGDNAEGFLLKNEKPSVVLQYTKQPEPPPILLIDDGRDKEDKQWQKKQFHMEEKRNVHRR